MGRHGAGRDAPDVSVVPPAGHVEDRARLAGVEDRRDGRQVGEVTAARRRVVREDHVTVTEFVTHLPHLNKWM